MNRRPRACGVHTLEGTFRALVDAAVKGERCPMNSDSGGWGSVQSSLVTDLARRGDIRIEISGRNWRTITILVGEHAGKTTLPNPEGRRVWLTIDRKTSRDVLSAKPVRTPVASTAGPPKELAAHSSFIRPLTKAELMRGRA